MFVGVFPLPLATLSKVFLEQTKSLDIGSCIDRVPRALEPKFSKVTASLTRHRKDTREADVSVPWKMRAPLVKG